MRLHLYTVITSCYDEVPLPLEGDDGLRQTLVVDSMTRDTMTMDQVEKWDWILEPRTLQPAHRVRQARYQKFLTHFFRESDCDLSLYVDAHMYPTCSAKELRDWAVNAIGGKDMAFAKQSELPTLETELARLLEIRPWLSRELDAFKEATKGLPRADLPQMLTGVMVRRTKKQWLWDQAQEWRDWLKVIERDQPSLTYTLVGHEGDVSVVDDDLFNHPIFPFRGHAKKRGPA